MRKQRLSHEYSLVHAVTEEEMYRAATDMSIAAAVAMAQERYSSSNDKNGLWRMKIMMVAEDV